MLASSMDAQELLLGIVVEMQLVAPPAQPAMNRQRSVRIGQRNFSAVCAAPRSATTTILPARICSHKQSVDFCGYWQCAYQKHIMDAEVVGDGIINPKSQPNLSWVIVR